MYNVHVYCPNYVVLIVGIDKKNDVILVVYKNKCRITFLRTSLRFKFVITDRLLFIWDNNSVQINLIYNTNKLYISV